MSSDFMIMCIREAAEELGYCDMKVQIGTDIEKVSATLACS